MDQSWPASDLLTLLDDAIGSDDCRLDSAGDASKNKLNMNKLYEFLANLAKNQFILQGLVDAHNQVFENSKNRLKVQMSVAKRPSNLPSKVSISDEVDSHTIINPIKPSSSNESASFEKPPLPDLKSDSKSVERKSTEPSISSTSLSSNLKQSQLSLLALNYAPQYEVDKLSKKLDHLNSKVNNLTKVNAELSVDKKRNSVSEQWSKHVLQKRIDTNEETLGKFSEMFDDLSAQIDNFKQDVSSALENTQAGDGAEIEKLKKKLQSVSDHLNESKSRLAACEGLVPEFESLSSKMLELSNSVKKAVEENSDLAKAQNSFEKMLLALEKKIKNATLAEGQEPTESAGLDFETMKQIDDIQNTTNKLTTRVSVIEEECAKFCKKEDMEDSVNLVKTQVLTDTAEKIAENFNVINEKVGQLDEENSRLNELIEMREESPAKGITESQMKGLNQENEKRRGSIKNKIHDLDEDINKRIGVLHTEMTANIESLDAELSI